MSLNTDISVADIEAAADYLRSRIGKTVPHVGMVFGSGLGGLVDAVEQAVFVDYEDVPGMPSSTVEMHAGRFCVGKIAGQDVICMQGRLHPYEGYTAQQVAFPIYVMHALGVQELFVTNAAGSIDVTLDVGDIMLIEDHINFQNMNPCTGREKPDLYSRFFDMTHAYAPRLRDEAHAAASALGLELRQGVYIGLLGPSFETPAEIRAFRTLGADAVGMSTIQEVIAANALDMDVLGISMISNLAAGVQDEPLSIEDVENAAKFAAEDVQRLIVELLNRRCS